MHQDGSDNLRMLITNQICGALRFHKVERFNTAGGIAGFENIFQQAGGSLFAKRFHQYRAQIIVGVDIQCGKLFSLLLKLRQNFGELLVGDLRDVSHCCAQGLYLARGEVPEHLCRPVFADGHQQDDALFGACQVTHDRYLSTGE